MVSNKHAGKIYRFSVLQIFFVIKICCKSFCFSMLPHVITESLSIIIAKYFPFSQKHVDIYHYSTFYLIYICFHEVYIFIDTINILLTFLISDPFLPAIILKTFMFKCFVLFGMHTLLDKLFRVLQILTDLSNLTVNG